MKNTIKRSLKFLKVYHFLQGNYRALLFYLKRRKLRKQFYKYKGEGFVCNICGAEYSRFADDFPESINSEAIEKNNVIAGYGLNIVCPHCLSTSRERLIAAMLESYDLKGKHILHLSPERNIYRIIRMQADVVTADLLPGFYTSIDKNISAEDATEFTFPDAHFDMVIANHILEHIPDDIKAMKEIFRVLKPGGNAILQVPYSELINKTLESPELNDPVMQSSLYGQKDHVRIYQLKEYIERLENTGFIVEEIPYTDLSSFYKFAIQEKECFLKISKPTS